MKEKKTTRTYRVIYWLVKKIYPKFEVAGTENLPAEPSIIVGNHTQTNGPLAGEFYFPGDHYIWCAGEMMHRETVAEYAFRDFWSHKKKWTHPFYKLLSKLIVPLALCLFNNAHTIGVYHDIRIMSTFKETVHTLSEGAHVIIYPEHNVKHNHIVNDFQRNFVDVAKLYHRREKKSVAFVPMYLAPKLRKMYLGKPIYFDPEIPIEQERDRICEYCMQQITEIATALPKHTVIPYRNVSKKLYPKNKAE